MPVLGDGLDDVLRQAMRVEYQSHGSVSENSGFRNHLDITANGAQVLDHGLMISEYLIHDNP
jgi:hypothetical protein